MIVAVAFAAVVATQHIAGARFEALAKPVLRGVALEGDARFEPASHVPEQIVPSGAVTLAVGNPLLSASYANVPVQVSVNGTYNRTVFVGYRIVRYVRTAVATHDVAPGSVLSPNDVAMERVPYFGQRINGTDVLVGRKVTGAVREGAPIYVESTQVNQIVKAGASVVLVVRDGGVSVVAEVVARQSGGLGDDVTVYDPQTNKTLNAAIVGPDRVELNLSEAH